MSTQPTTKSGKTRTYVCECGKTVSTMASSRHYRQCPAAQAAAKTR
jgi:hypothetical protein